MIAMSKEQMINYLKDYAEIQYILINNPDMPISRAFTNYMLTTKRYTDNNIDYYDRMRRVYSSYIFLKKYSMVEDYLLNKDDFLNNDDLNGLEKWCNFIIAPKNITNKRIARLIRNSFNHNNDNNIETFHFSLNAKSFEINFDDIRNNSEKANNDPEKPIRIKFNTDYLYKITDFITTKRQTLLFLSFNIPDDFNIFSDNLDTELDKIIFIHYYFNKKLPKETIEQFQKLANIKGLSKEELLERSAKIHHLAREINAPIEYRLDKYQKNKLKELIMRYRGLYKRFLNDDINAIMYYFLSKVIPIPLLKQEEIEQQFILCNSYYQNVNLSMEKITKRLFRIVNKDRKQEDYDEIDNIMHDRLINRGSRYAINFLKNTLSIEFILLFPTIIYIDSVIMHCCDDAKIKIKKEIFEKDKIRNCFAHGRWYINEKYEIVLYDANPRNINDYNLEYVGKIDIMAFKKWADEYMNNAKKSNKRLK